MAEKKTTKAEQKRIELAVKHTFISDVFKVFMEKYVTVVGDSRYSVALTVTIKNNNHYICFDDFGRSFSICIYTNGNVEIKMKEYGKEDYVGQLFEYTSDLAAQAEFLEELNNGLAVLVLLPGVDPDGDMFENFSNFIREFQIDFSLFYEAFIEVQDIVLAELDRFAKEKDEGGI